MLVRINTNPNTAWPSWFSLDNKLMEWTPPPGGIAMCQGWY